MVAAIIVLFYPKHDQVLRLLTSLAGHADAIYAIDNTSGSFSPAPAYLRGIAEPLHYLPLGENKGIAAAQNAGIAACIQAGIAHVLFLDQDSELPAGMVTRLLEAEKSLLKNGEKVGVIAPQIVDHKTGMRPSAVHYQWLMAREFYAKSDASGPVRSDNLISSGSMIRICALQEIGLMRADLFIEYVDTEWVMRSQRAGYSSYCVPGAVMMHNFGDAARTAFGKSFYLYSNARFYYKLRNEVYLARLKTMGWQWRAYALSRIPYHFFLYTALAQKRCEALCLMLRAVSDGMLGRLGPLAERAAGR
jgi:rhamnosyltransferase